MLEPQASRESSLRPNDRPYCAVYVTCAATGERLRWPVGAKGPEQQSNLDRAGIEKARMLIV